MSKVRSLLIALCIGAPLAASSALAQKPFQIEQRWVIGGDGGWDYLTVDSSAHRLYIAHQTRVDVVDTSTGKSIGTIDGLTRCHGIVILPDGKTGFISDGGANNVVVFDTAKLTTLTKIPAGTNPDGMVLEHSTGTLWAFNGTSHNATVIDVNQRKAIGLVALPGKPEFPVTDDKGTVFVNIEDKNSVVRLDAKTQKVTATWPLAGCESPSGQSFDRAAGRLFAVCDGNKMAITNASTGKSLATPTIGADPDATSFDPKSKLVFSSNGDGTMTIIDTAKPGFPVVQNLTTMKGARTMTFDAATGKAYTVSSKFSPNTAPATPGHKSRPIPVPNTFTVLAISR